MNIQTLSQSKTLAMSSREIAELTQKEHKNVTRTIESLISAQILTAQIEPLTFNHRGNDYKYYELNKRDSLVVVARLSPEFTAAVVDRWQYLEEKQKPQLPKSFAEALQLAADQARQLELAAPKIDFHDKLVNDAATFSLRDAAKKIQQRPNKFSQWLRDEGYLCQNNLAKQQYINQGLFKTHTGTSRDEFQFNQARMTSKGLSYFTKKLGEIKL
ncbi:Rha family regulatory protein [Vibrio phage 1.205.O._10N.222.51.A7]|nr:Rha family regulatory protein [Vibrio phage 1.205.O._10N.222.51.A7]